MKSLFFSVSFFLIFTSSVLSQESNSHLQDKISFSPFEVTSSAIINLDFEQAGQFFLKAHNKETNEEFDLHEIEKGTEKRLTKIDLSFLENGNYFLIVHLGTSEIKRFDFTKK